MCAKVGWDSICKNTQKKLGATTGTQKEMERESVAWWGRCAQGKARTGAQGSAHTPRGDSGVSLKLQQGAASEIPDTPWTTPTCIERWDKEWGRNILTSSPRDLVTSWLSSPRDLITLNDGDHGRVHACPLSRWDELQGDSKKQSVANRHPWNKFKLNTRSRQCRYEMFWKCRNQLTDSHGAICERHKKKGLTFRGRTTSLNLSVENPQIVHLEIWTSFSARWKDVSKKQKNWRILKEVNNHEN